MDFSLVQHFGYAEMYEWKTLQENRFGYLVELDDKETNKIIKAKNPNNVIGVSSINFASLSDNPNRWHKSYYRNDVGDTYLNKKIISFGKKKYNQIDEFAFISTEKNAAYIPKEFENYDNKKKYLQRIDRPEWSPVTLIGKSIVIDNGECNGLYCQLYNGTDESKFGTVVPVYDESLPKYRILERYSSKTLLILFK